MEKIRNWLLKNNLTELYEMIVGFMRTPDSHEINEVLDKTPTEIFEETRSVLNTIMQDFACDRQIYHDKYTYGQIIIWETVLSAYEELTQKRAIIEGLSFSQDFTNYYKTVAVLKKALKAYAGMQNELSELENTLGIDRFLDRIGEDTFAILIDILRSAKETLENKTDKLKECFQANWSSTNVYHAIGHSIVRRNDGNQVCVFFTSGCEQNILFVIDGLGYCQYLWNNGIESKETSFTFNENLFKWLSDNRLSRELILGSSYITDTGAGLAQIFFGQSSWDTGIFASKLKNKESNSNFFETKRLSESEFNSTFKYHNSITDVITTFRGDSKVYYCSRYQDPPSGFSKNLFKSAEVQQVLPPERVFAVILNDIASGMDKGLQIQRPC